MYEHHEHRTNVPGGDPIDQLLSTAQKRWDGFVQRNWPFFLGILLGLFGLGLTIAGVAVIAAAHSGFGWIFAVIGVLLLAVAVVALAYGIKERRRRRSPDGVSQADAALGAPYWAHLTERVEEAYAGTAYVVEPTATGLRISDDLAGPDPQLLPGQLKLPVRFMLDVAPKGPSTVLVTDGRQDLVRDRPTGPAHMETTQGSISMVSTTPNGMFNSAEMRKPLTAAIDAAGFTVARNAEVKFGIAAAVLGGGIALATGVVIVVAVIADRLS